ncbi:MAG: hypothetical protein ACYCTF_09480 [Acidiferrobacter sp.]
MRQSLAPARAVRFQFEKCRATVAADTPGTQEWRRRFWLREGVIGLGETGMVLLGAFALWHLAGSLPAPLHLIGLLFGSLVLSARLVSAVGQIAARFRTLDHDIVHYHAHQAYIDAQILSTTLATLALWSISEKEVVAAGLVPDGRAAAHDGKRYGPRTET